MINRHLIGKQVLELEIASSKNAYALQQKVSEFVWKELSAKMSVLFDSMITEDQVLSIDLLEIDLGEIAIEDIGTARMSNLIISLLEEKIREKLGNHLYKEKYYGSKGNRQSQKLFDYKNGFSAKGENQYKNLDNEISNQRENTPQLLRRYYFEAWLYWLHKGTFSSYSIVPEDNWIILVLETLGTDIQAVTQLEQILKKYPIALRRLIVQHSSKELRSIVELYTGYAQKEFIQILKEIKLNFNDKQLTIFNNTQISLRALEIKIWEKVYELVIFKRLKCKSSVIGVEVIKFLLEENVILTNNLQRLVSKTQNKNKSKNRNVDQYNTLKRLLKDDSVLKAMRLKSEDFIENKTLEKFIKNDGDHLISEIKAIESPQYFKNAGLVMLHPFFNHLLKKINFIKEEKFISFETRSKAVLLLHFLATGEEHPKEYEMVLPKFLCELPVNAPIDRSICLSKKEKEEANTLLKAVIEHWGAIGTASPDGLREGFLKREGKLEKEETGWKLFVEQKTIDILLDKLPWSISIIKLPWMKEMLKIEWR